MHLRCIIYTYVHIWIKQESKELFVANGFGLATTQTQGETRIPVRKLNPLQSLFRKPSQQEIGARCGGTSLYSEIEATKSQRVLRVAWSTGKRKDSQSYTTDDTSWKRTSAVAQLLVKGQLLCKHSAWVCSDPQHKGGKHGTLWWEPPWGGSRLPPDPYNPLVSQIWKLQVQVGGRSCLKNKTECIPQGRPLALTSGHTSAHTYVDMQLHTHAYHWEEWCQRFPVWRPDPSFIESNK